MSDSWLTQYNSTDANPSTSWYRDSASRKFRAMAHGHPRSRLESPLPRPDLPTQADVQLKIPYWYSRITSKH